MSDGFYDFEEDFFEEIDDDEIRLFWGMSRADDMRATRKES